ncbi:DUF2771 family protein [Crossiella sp. CA-258035]|uniref:DUF2771 family protein n=1 Tax=Crossiella sp. CA-258035 TaxID=2981138 RepID=UPI0024BC1506|nr:DUF2771 family protein [Crossiella sp. CA-258035]WHT20001.1 DUF2771 family protein [Crossiella sp. CA-258035]
MHKGLSLLLAAAALSGVAACAAPVGPPEVTLFAAGKSIAVKPSQYCDVKVENCQADPKAAGVLRVPKGQEVKISVDPRIGETPWQVVFRYRKPDNGKVDGRSEAFAPNKTLAYTLKLPEADAQLETIEVHQYGAAISANTEGGVSFGTRGTWVISVDDRG